MGATVHPHSLAARGSAAAIPRACASSSSRSILINPACVAKPAAAVAKKPKRPASFQEGHPPAKRARGDCGEVERDAAAAAKIQVRPGPSSDKQGRCPVGALRSGVEALSATKNLTSASPAPAAPPKPPARSMSELIERARLAKARSAAPAGEAEAEAEAMSFRRREIERRRAEARREMDLAVQTVEFNDPFLDVLGMFQ